MMRIFFEILGFELRQQIRSPFLLAALLIFFLIHVLAASSTGINLWAHPQANLNSAYAIAVVETTLTVFGMLPAIVFVASAVLRDHDTATAELFFVKPISRWQYLWGRFGAACLLSALLGLAGILGSLTGTLMPWVDQERIAAFSIEPFVFCYFAIVLPNMLILCALFFSVACLSRSLAAAVGLALVLLVSDVALAGYALDSDRPGLLVLADHSATLLVSAASRNLTVPELNTLLPQTLLVANRLLWLAFVTVVLLVSFKRFRLEVAEGRAARRLRNKDIAAAAAPAPLPSTVELTVVPGDSAAAQLFSQLRMDFTGVMRSPLFVLILLLGIVSAVNDYGTHVSPIMSSPLYPVTSSMLDFFRHGVFGLVLIIIIYYSGMVVHREREAGIAQMVDAAPMPDWILPVSKTLALCAVVTVLLFVMLLTSIGLQAVNGQMNFELHVYLRAVFLYNGFYYWMLCVLAVLVQIAVSNKWLGLLLVLAISIGLQSIGAFGFEHVLYGFAIPQVVYSDMNGFGPVAAQAHALIGYWGCFCVLLILLGHLLYPRGVYASFAERAHEARARLSTPVLSTMGLFIVGFAAAGSWIFYNTNVLNTYQTSQDRQQRQADYERAYGRYENQPTPSYSDIDVQIDLFPQERRLASRGSGTLTNNKSMPIAEFVISVHPDMHVDELRIDRARLATADAVQGFYLFRLDAPLSPGASVPMRWKVSRSSRGFVNSNPDTELVPNGTFIASLAIMPMPGFDEERKLTDNAKRREFGLPPAPRLAALGDPAYLDNLGFGVDGRSTLRIVLSTAADQTAVTHGRLQREWQENGRRYFEYVAERKVWPVFYVTSGRYQLARDTWTNGKQDVTIEIYYHPAHAYNVAAYMATAKRSLDYFTREFAPYQYSHLRIMEYPRYRGAVKALPGGVAYSERSGWIANLANLDNIDYTTIHETGHMWWGDKAPGAKMQGREMLNETMAQYCVLMVFKDYDDGRPGPDIVNRIIGELQRGYLRARSSDSLSERPVMYTEEQGHLSYNKGPLAIYALQELIGEETVNRGLSNFLAKFDFKSQPPYATSRDLVNELRAVAGPEYQDLITDLFEKITLYELELRDASGVQVADGYEVALTVAARQLEADGRGAESEAPLHTWFDVGLFADAQQALVDQEPLYLQKHFLKSGINTIVVKTAQKAAFASVDPYQKMADRWTDDNGRAVGGRASGVATLSKATK